MSKKNKPVYLLDFVCPDCSSTLFYKANDMFTNAICICCERNFWLNPEDFTRNPSNKEKQMSSPEMYEVTILERNDQTLNVIVNVTTVTAKNRDAAIIKMAVGHLAQCLKKDGSINIDNLEVRTRPFVGTET